MSSDYRLTDAFPYLLNRVGVRMGELFSRRLEPHGLTLSTYRVLAAIRERGPQSLGALSDVASIEVSTLSRRVGALVEDGLLSRRRPSSNGRTVVIDLTGKGRALVEELIPVAQLHEDVGLRGFDRAAVAALKRDLARVYENLDALAGARPDEEPMSASSPDPAPPTDGARGRPAGRAPGTRDT